MTHVEIQHKRWSNIMENLITIDEKGLVSARELYLGLGLNKTNWSRWYPSNIEKNDFFVENVDWIGVRHYDEGNEIIDFAISIEFAKHIAMQSKAKKSHEYRSYFIAVEKKLKEVMKPMTIEEIIILQAQSVGELKTKVALIEESHDKLTERFNNLDATNITGTPRQRLKLLVDKYSFDKGVTYSTGWGDFKSNFNVAYHTNVENKKKHFMSKNKLKVLSNPDYLERIGLINDALRVADKMANEVAR